MCVLVNADGFPDRWVGWAFRCWAGRDFTRVRAIVKAKGTEKLKQRELFAVLGQPLARFVLGLGLSRGHFSAPLYPA